MLASFISGWKSSYKCNVIIKSKLALLKVQRVGYNHQQNHTVKAFHGILRKIKIPKIALFLFLYTGAYTFNCQICAFYFRILTAIEKCKRRIIKQSHNR